MKILVIDDEQSFANLLGHALRRLGHSPVIALDPRDALELVSEGFDAVITDIDMPVMDGVSLARTIRERHTEVPVAFCTGSNPEGETVAQAQTIGRVLPKVWTVADVRSLLDDLAEERQRLRRMARGSVRDLRASDLPRPALTGREMTPRPELPVPARARLRRVRLDVSDWRRVEGLCKSSVEGPVFITVRSPGEASPGDSLSVALRMPDEITVSIAGEVQALRPAGDDRESELIVELTGLTTDLASRLASLAAPSKDALAGQYFDARRPHALAWSGAPRNRRATSADGNDGSCHGRPNRADSNDELRSQIEVLGRRMRRKS